MADEVADDVGVSWDGRLIKAEDLQLATLTSLNQEFATVIDSEALLASLAADGVEEA